MVVEIPHDLDKVSTGYLAYLNGRVQEVLRALYASRPEEHRQPDSYVFCYGNGKQRRSIRERWRSACERAGVEGLHIRGLRATAATRLQERGATELDIKLHLGHTTKSMGVTSRYVDPHEEHRRRIADAGPEWLGRWILRAARVPALADRVVASLADHPELFKRLLEIATGERRPGDISIPELARLVV